MKINPLFITFFYIFFNICDTFAQHDIADAKGISISESSEKGITIRFRPQSWRVDTVHVNNKDYIQVGFFGSNIPAEPGHPAFPVLYTTIGIPENAELTYEVLEAEGLTIFGKLIPQPQVVLKNGIDSYLYAENDSAYTSAELYPTALVELGESGYYRNQRVTRVIFKPVQFEPHINQIVLHQVITIRIHFSDSSGRNTAIEAAPDEHAFYDGVVLNYQQSKKWLRQSEKSLQKYHFTSGTKDWHKIYIKDEGIYRITGSMLVDFGIDIKSIDPATLRIYNNGGRELSRSVYNSPSQSLIENAILVEDGGDGVFDILDYFLFYGKSVNNWSYNPVRYYYEHYLNHYEDYNVYWLSWGDGINGKRMERVSVADESSLTPEPFFISPYYFEQDVNNVLGSGYQWFSRLFIPNDEYSFTANLPNAISDESFFLFSFVGWTSGTHSFTVQVNGKQLSSFSHYGKGQSEVQKMASGLISPGYNQVKIKYTSSNETNQAYLDWFEIHFKRNFTISDDQLIFYTTPGESFRRYHLTGFTNEDIKIFDVTDYDEVKLLSDFTVSNKEVNLVDAANLSESKKMFAVASVAFKIPERVEKVSLADLRNTTNKADFIIIAHDDFYEAALPLAQHRQVYDELITRVVRISDVYNEFSWGLIDPGAIRDFIKYAFQHWSVPPQYILLFGDGDYDYKNMVNKEDKNWLPPFETSELDEHNNRTIDDWFVYVSGNDTYADLAIGRLPVRSAEQARTVVNKIIAYETSALLDEASAQVIDDWRNTVTMVGDDELTEGGTGEETIHTTDAENIIELNRYIPNHYNKKKIYLSEYPALKNVSYFSALLKPTATDAIINQINQGTLIMNYIGHGNPNTWSHEYVLYAPRDFEKFQNGVKLAFWIAATCDFGRFDDPAQQGLAENLITAEGRGAIGVLASTRLAFAQNNAALNRSFYSALFYNKNETERLGLALLKAKMDNGSDINSEKYVLLGDPSMRLAAPRYNAKITSIQPDTIRALSHITIQGQIMKDNRTWDDFQGKALIKAYDSKKQREYSTAGGRLMKYNLPGNTIFRGVGKINQGKFEISFIVPKDITYGGSLGRVNVYFANEETHGSGYQDSLFVGGTSQIVDSEGPGIEIGFLSQNFFNEAYTSEIPVLKLGISDTLSGVNIVGEIGHHITMILDDDVENKIILTDLFQYDEGSYTSGTVLYDFRNHPFSGSAAGSTGGGLNKGTHSIEIKAWDNSNNSNSTRSEFVVVSSSELELKDVLNYPNPFASTTIFTFWTSQDCEATIKIYTVAGRLIRRFEGFPLQMNELAQIPWDGRDEDGNVIANGVYIYKVIAKARVNHELKTAEEVQKLIIMR